MSGRSKLVFLLLVAVQAAHSAEEYVTRLYEIFLPAKFVSGLVSDDLRIGFIVINAAIIVLGAWCYLFPVRSGLRAGWVVAWLWLIIETANGIGHLLIAASVGGYFPGVLTGVALVVVAVSLGFSLTMDKRNQQRLRSPPNNRMQRTVQNVMHFACAKCAPFCSAADAWR